MTGTAPARRRGVIVVTLTMALLGALAVAVAVWASPYLPLPADDPGYGTQSAYLLVLLGAFLAELITVPLQHDQDKEDLTFFEIAVVAGMLVLAPVPAVLAPLGGLALALLLLRPPVVKVAFNLGSYAASTALAVLVYLVLANGAPRFGVQGVVALFVAMALWVAANTVFLAAILHAATGVPQRQVYADVWSVSGLTSVASVATGAVIVAVAGDAPALLPFTFFPVLALWYAYRAASQHARERERNRSLVRLGTALASPSSQGELLESAPESVRDVVRAGCAEVILPGRPGAGRMAPGTVRTMPLEVLPDGWASGIEVGLDLGAGSVGTLMLGALAGGPRWTLDPDDEPMLLALAASLAGALRSAEQHEAVRAEAAKLQAVVEHAMDGIVVVTEDDDVSVWSPAMERISGLSAPEAVAVGEARPATTRLLLAAAGLPGMLYDPGIPGSAPPFPGLALPMRESLLMAITRPDGEVREVQVSIVRQVDEALDRQIAVLTVHDVTRERRIDRLKSDFVAQISHELRTPITPIKGYAQLLAARGDQMTPERRAEALELIAERADHLARLVDDLLLATRVQGEAGARLRTEEGEADLVHLVRTTAAGFPSLAARLHLELPDEPVPVRCDPTRTRQCVANLISNAGKYAPDGSPIDIVVAPAGPDGTHALVTVADHGAGIPLAEQERVFERFYRVEDVKTGTGGSGLGLYIARQLARAMGGDLTLESSPGRGAAFTLSVLLSLDADASLAPSEPAAPAVPRSAVPDPRES